MRIGRSEVSAAPSAVITSPSESLSRRSPAVVVEVTGPYGQANFIPATYSSVLLVVGGSGVSFALGVIEGLLRDCTAGDGRTTSVELVWTVRESDMLQYMLPYFRDILAASLAIPTISLSIRLHCTTTSFPPAAIATHSLKHLREAGIAPTVVYGTRPDLGAILSSLAERTPTGGGLAVCSCGPQPLVDSVARLVDGMDKALKARTVVECSSECVRRLVTTVRRLPR
jgi:ferric-chelate reductase